MKNNCNSGFSLIEVLVALLILSFGLLALAGLQMTGIKANHSSLLRTKATYAAYEMADRMRANRVGITANAYNNASGIPSDPGCISTNCSTSQLATTDIREWNLQNAAMMPNGSGVVCLDSTPDDGTSVAPACDGIGTIYAIKIWWSDDKTTTLKRFITTFIP